MCDMRVGGCSDESAMVWRGKGRESENLEDRKNIEILIKKVSSVMPVFMGTFGLWRVPRTSVPVQKSWNSGGASIRRAGILDRVD